MLATPGRSGMDRSIDTFPDTRHFDDSTIRAIPNAGETVRLALVELPPRYVGHLEHFSQFTDAHAANPALAATPEFEWMLRVNGRPLAPYQLLRQVVNPWGYGSCYALRLRIDRGARLELLLRRVPGQATTVQRVGGRLAGRYWFDADPR